MAPLSSCKKKRLELRGGSLQKLLQISRRGRQAGRGLSKEFRSQLKPHQVSLMVAGREGARRTTRSRRSRSRQKTAQKGSSPVASDFSGHDELAENRVLQLRTENVMLKQEVIRMKDLVRVAAGRVEEVEKQLSEVIHEEDREREMLEELMGGLQLENKETENTREQVLTEAGKRCQGLQVFFEEKDEQLAEFQKELEWKIDLQSELKGLVEAKREQLRQIEETVRALREQREEGRGSGTSFQIELARKEEELKHLRISLNATTAEAERALWENKTLCIEKGMLASKLEEKGEQLQEALDMATEYKREMERLRSATRHHHHLELKGWITPTLAACGSAVAVVFVSLLKATRRSR